MNSLFLNFSKCIGRIKGELLFKGKLMMLVRDVRGEDAAGAFTELEASIR